MADEEKLKIYRCLFYPGMLVLLLWVIKGVDTAFDLGLNRFGLWPLHYEGLIGIFTAPLLHADVAHLFANSVPLLILGALLFYFYREIAWQILALTWSLTGLWVWTFARDNAVHIGASGVVYGLASFLFFSGIIRRAKSLMVITLLVTFLYGGMIWGIFPQLFPNQPISWESHLMGLLAGAILAVYFRKRGPQRQEYQWEEEEEEQEDQDDQDGPDGNDSSWSQPEVHYHPPEK
jgi:membrane associated rhomboid family serine protease